MRSAWASGLHLRSCPKETCKTGLKGELQHTNVLRQAEDERCPMLYPVFAGKQTAQLAQSQTVLETGWPDSCNVRCWFSGRRGPANQRSASRAPASRS